MGSEHVTPLRILSISSTPASTKFLHRVQAYLEPEISMRVLNSEQLLAVATSTNYSKISKRLLLLPSFFVSVVAVLILYIFEIFVGIRNKSRTESTPFTKWFSYIYSIKIDRFYDKQLNLYSRMLSTLRFPNIDRFLLQCEGISRLVESEKYDLLLLPGENILLGSPLIIRHAKRLQLPSVIYDFAQPEKSWKSIFTNPVVFLDKFQNFIAIHGWEKYKIQVGKSQFALPIFAQTIAEITGGSPVAPWSACGGLADEYLAPSERFVNYYNQLCNIDGNKIHKIISVEKSIAIEIQRQFDDTNNNTFSRQILVLLPPDQFGRGNSGIDSIFTDWLSIVDKMLEISKLICPTGMKIVAALHPRAEDSLEKLSQLYPDIHFTTEDIVLQIVKSRMVFSSTSSLDEVAADLEIPTVIWNVYGYQLERNYKEFSFIECVENRKDPSPTLKQLLSSPRNKINETQFGKNLSLTLQEISKKHTFSN